MRGRDKPGTIRKLGVFGGTFNPIHLAHLRCAEEIAENFALDRVLFVPSGSPPHKSAGIAPAEDRLAMVRLAVRGNPRFRASAIEVNRGGRSYSVDTLRELRRRFGAAVEIFFIVGMDAFLEIGTWREPEEVFALAHLVVISRPPYDGPPALGKLPIAVRRHICYRPTHRGRTNHTGQQISFYRVTALEISASDVRNRVARGLSIRYLVPPPVESYIRRQALYQTRKHRH